VVVVVEGVGVDEESSHSSVDVASPPPAVVFSGQLEIKQSHRDERSDNDQQNESNQQDSK